MGSSRVFLGVRQRGELVCFDTWTRDGVVDGHPYVLLGRVLPPLGRLGLNRVAGALLAAKHDASDGSFESAVEYWLEALEDDEEGDGSRAGVVVPNVDLQYCGVVLDLDARAVDWLRRGPALTAPVEQRGMDAHGFVAALRIPEPKLAAVAEVFQALTEGLFDGLVDTPTGDDWERRVIHDGDESILTAAVASAKARLLAGVDDAHREPLPPGFVRHDLYVLQMFVPTSDTVVVSGRRVHGTFQPVWAALAHAGTVCPILVEPGEYEIWQQQLSHPLMWPDDEMDALLRGFSEADAKRIDHGSWALEEGDTEPPALSIVRGHLGVEGAGGE